MPITHPGPLSTGQANSATLTIGSVEVFAGSNRMFTVSAHSRGNAGSSEFTSVVFVPVGGGPVEAAFTEVNDIDADSIIHSDMFELKEADFPSAGLYDLVFTTGGAFQVIGYAQQLAGVDQTLATIVGGRGEGGTSNSILLNPGAPLLTVPQDGCMLHDNTSGDNAQDVTAATQLTRDDTFTLRQGSLATGSSDTFVDVADSPINLGYTFAGGMNRRAIGYALYQPAGGAPATVETNVCQFGASF